MLELVWRTRDRPAQADLDVGEDLLIQDASHVLTSFAPDRQEHVRW